MKFKMSICIYNNNQFDILIKDEYDNEICFTGKQKLSPEEFRMIDGIAPACVWTTFKRED